MKNERELILEQFRCLRDQIFTDLCQLQTADDINWVIVFGNVSNHLKRLSELPGVAQKVIGCDPAELWKQVDEIIRSIYDFKFELYRPGIDIGYIQMIRMSRCLDMLIKFDGALVNVLYQEGEVQNEEGHTEQTQEAQ